MTRTHRTIARLCLVASVTLAIVALAAALGCGASQRQKAQTITLATVDSAAAGFAAYDAAHQLDIAAKATSLEDGKAKLAAYRERRSKVLLAIETVRAAVVVAQVLADDPKSLANLGAAAVQLYAAIAELEKP